MVKWDKLPDQILRKTSDANIPFDDLCHLLLRLGFERRTRDSHNIFRKQGIPEMPNLQRSVNNAKPCQVRQIRAMILDNKLAPPIP